MRVRLDLKIEYCFVIAIVRCRGELGTDDLGPARFAGLGDALGGEGKLRITWNDGLGLAKRLFRFKVKLVCIGH